MFGINSKNAMNSPLHTSQADERANKKHRRKRGGKNRNRSKPYSHKDAEQRYAFC